MPSSSIWVRNILKIVKGGNVSNNVITHPQAGVAYASPVNAGGKQASVSHWIVCKGTTPTPPPVVTPHVSATVAGAAVCNPDTHEYDITWTGAVTGEFPTYVGQRVKYLGTTPPTMVGDMAPGDAFTYVTHVPGTATTADATFHVHLTQQAAGVDPLDTDATGTVSLAGDCIAPVPPTIQQCTTTGSTQFTSLADWTMTETRATGHNELVDGGLHVWTEGATSTDKAAGYYPASFALKDAGTGFGVTATGTGTAQPSLQMLVDLDGNGSPEGYLVAEPVYGADTLWLSSNWTHIDLTGAPTTVNGGGTGLGGSANAWLAAFPDAQVMAIGYSLGSGVQGDWTITAITAGCHVYTFTRPEAPVYEPAVTVENGDWTGGEPTCDNPEVEQSRTVTTTRTEYTR